MIDIELITDEIIEHKLVNLATAKLFHEPPLLANAQRCLSKNFEGSDWRNRPGLVGFYGDLTEPTLQNLAPSHRQAIISTSCFCWKMAAIITLCIRPTNLTLVLALQRLSSSSNNFLNSVFIYNSQLPRIRGCNYETPVITIGGANITRVYCIRSKSAKQ